MASFKLSAELLNGMCKKGYTVEEMATEITNQAGVKCSVGQVRKACKHYNISLKAKPRKSAFELDDVVTEIVNNTNNTTNSTEETVENTVGSIADLV